jgi:anti-sigma factor RsiW
MNCNWVQNRLVAYLDAELPTQGRLNVESHLSACSQCREALLVFERTRPGPGTPTEHPPEFWAPMREAVIRELEARPAPPAWHRYRWTLAYSFLFLLVIGWSLTQSSVPGASP